MEVGSTTLKNIHDDGFQFAQFYTEFAESVFSQANLAPVLSGPRLEDAHGAWRNDLDRVGANEKKLKKGLDHFKQAGHLAFWLRRFSPIIDSKCILEDCSATSEQESWRKYLYAYSNEHVAFLVGFNVCRFYEQCRSDRFDSPRAFDLKVGGEYLNMVCNFLKFKTASPHAITMIYKSLFLQ